MFISLKGTTFHLYFWYDEFEFWVDFLNFFLGFLMTQMSVFFDNVESMRRLGLWRREPYPERSGTSNCSFYMRTGSCGYGAKCRYNHPPDRSSVSC